MAPIKQVRVARSTQNGGLKGEASISDRRRQPLTRHLLKFLPAKLRFAIMRSHLKISPELDSRFAFRIARTKEELSEAYRILHDSYLDLGYAKPHVSGMRIVKYFALPSTTTLIALFDNKVVGTVSIVRRGAFGLPMESAFDLSEFIDRNEVIAEVSSLAIDSKFRQKRGALFLPLLKFFWEYVEQFMNLDSIVITVNPAMTDFYEGFLSFKRLRHAQVDDYGFANGNPGVGLYLNVREAPQLFKALYGHKPADKNLFRYFVDLTLPHFELPHRRFYKSSDPVMTPEMLEHFFVNKSDVFSELTQNERLGLAATYPLKDYRKILPTSSIETLRQDIRYAVNLQGVAASHQELNLTILDVTRQGLCVASAVELNGIILIRIKVAGDRIAEVRGEVRWEDKGRKIYGIQLLKTDSHWGDFVGYLRNDFHTLTKKVG